MSCQTCQAQLNEIDIKKHLRSDWHIYNLRRSLVALPPLSEEIFLQKEEQFRLLNNANSSDVSARKKFYCEICKKCFKSNKSYECHIASQQHLKKKKSTELEKSAQDEVVEKKLQSESESEEECAPEEFSPSEFGKPLPVGSCFFCDTTYEGNPNAIDCVLSHMKKRHNFILPYLEKLVDAKGLLADLGRIVGEEFACLGCGRQFLGRKEDRHKKSPAELRNEALSSVRKHMIDKEHNFLYTGVEDPVLVSVAIAESGEVDETNVPPIARVGGELYSQYYNGEQANKTLVLPSSEDKFAENETYEVHLPSGGTVGHRRYFQTVFRQNPCAHLELPSSSREGPAALSWKAHPRSKALLALSETEIARLAIMEDRGRRVDLKRRSRQDMKLGIRGNTVLAKHFRSAQ